MSAPTRRPPSQRGSGTLRSTADHGGEDDTAPPPPRRRSMAIERRSATAPSALASNNRDELVMGWEHRMDTDERRRAREEEEEGRGSTNRASSFSSGGRGAKKPSGSVGRSTSGTYARYGRSAAGSEFPASPSDAVAAAGSRRAKSFSHASTTDNFIETPTITPGRGIPEGSSVRYGNREPSRRSAPNNLESNRDDQTAYSRETAYSRATQKVSNRTSDLRREPSANFSSPRADRKEQRRRSSTRVKDELGDEPRRSRIMDDLGSSDERRRSSKKDELDTRERRRTSRDDGLTSEERRAARQERRRSSKEDTMSPRTNRKGEKEAVPSRKSSRRKSERKEPRLSEREKIREEAARRISETPSESNGREDVRKPRGDDEARKARGNDEVRKARGDDEVRKPRGDDEVRKPRGDDAVVRKDVPVAKANSAVEKRSSYGETSSVSSSARNRLRERMLGDLDNSSGSSRDRVKAILSLDTPKSRKKSETPTFPPVAEKEAEDTETESARGEVSTKEKVASIGTKKGKKVRSNTRVKESANNVATGTPVSSTTSSSSSSSVEELSSSEATESSDADSDEEQWSVRVSVLSAVDLPTSVVPNVPLCPVLKFGLVTVPATEEEADQDAEYMSSANTRLSVLTEMEKKGLEAIPKSRVRCTSTKILAKRDNGAVEFHEEMRWDKVQRPLRTALAVELCARAVLPPPNAHESPVPEGDPNLQTPLPSPTSPQKGADPPDARSQGRGFRSMSMNAGAPPNADESSNTASGIAGMRALWRKRLPGMAGRQPSEQQRQRGSMASGQSEMEAATAAAAVARFLVGGSSADNENSASEHSAGSRPFGDDDDSLPSFQKVRSQELPIGENVALIRPPLKRQKVEMAEDLRLRSLVIPLTRLPLEKATSGGEAARIEQWYQMDGSNNSSLQWRESQRGPSLQRRNPSILLEITFSPPGVLDNEDDVGQDGVWGGGNESIGSGLQMIPEGGNIDADGSTRRRSATISSPQPKTPTADSKPEDPVLQPGVVDFVCVVGARDIGNQRSDNGAKGWVNSTPDYTVLERFPPTDDFHINHGRMTALPDKIEWFCFPEGCKLWRGSYPPTHHDLNIKRGFSASSSPNVSSSMAVFDACLNCTTSFSWWVLSSTSEDYGSKNKKTYGACVRFYAPAPPGIDPTQDDFAQSFLGGEAVESRKKPGSTAKRLWVPLGICLVSSLPIVGVMESMLLRICEQLSSRTGNMQTATPRTIVNIVHQDLANLIVNFQRPIPGVLHCSIPFLQGERLHLTLPPPTGLPPLPHGASITMVCRLLGAEGLNILLAAVLTECKILVHSDDIANLALVAEVITTLIYPFDWALPYIPVLPDAMLEFVEAPLSYFLGIPTSSLKLIEPHALADVVVIDLDNGFSSPDYFDGRRTGRSSKVPTSLPASVASNISKAVFRLLREEEEVEEQYGAASFPGSRSLPRLEAESLAEREFRIALALQICGLVRGYQECLIFVSASQPVFNRDRFLRNAPALFEDRRGNLPAFANPVDSGSSSLGSQRMLSPRSKRFLSLLVNTQHFHGLLDRLDFDDIAFFHEVMDSFDMSDDQSEVQTSSGVLSGYGSSKLEIAASHLSKALQKVEDKIPTYRADRKAKRKRRSGGGWDDDDDGHTAFENFLDGNESVCFANDTLISSFTSDLLQQIFANEARGDSNDDDSVSSGNSAGIHSLSIEYMVKLEKNPWRYRKLFDIPTDEDTENTEKKDRKKSKSKVQAKVVEVREKVKLRDAIGDRRYRAWKLAQEQKLDSGDDSTVQSTADVTSPEGQSALDLTSLLSSATDDMRSDTSSMTSASSQLSINLKRKSSGLSPEQQRVADAKDRDVLRRCLERAYEGAPRRSSRSVRKSSGSSSSNSAVDSGRDYISEAETALRNPSAQRFLVSVLSQRSRIENRKKKRFTQEDAMKGSRHHRQTTQSSVSRLQPVAFECLVRLCCAMLDACMEENDYEPAYRLLTQTAGFCTVRSRDGDKKSNSPTKDLEDAEHSSRVIYMTARIGLHPIFADLRLWETVLALHLQDRQNEKGTSRSANNSGISTPTDSLAGSGTSNKIPNELAGSLAGGKVAGDTAEYEAAVATLYEMLGFGIPAEELARFANHVSEEHGWFATERGHSFLMLARRLSVRRDEVEDGVSGAGDLDMLRSGGKNNALDTKSQSKKVGGGTSISKLEWSEVGWSHPAAGSMHLSRDESAISRSGSSSPRALRSGGYESLDVAGMEDDEVFGNGASQDRLDRRSESGSKYLKRTAVTSIASFGSSVVASGSIDGSVFLAHTIEFGGDDDREEKDPVVRGVRLEWGDSDQKRRDSSPMDGESGPGAICCLAAAKGAGYRHGYVFKNDKTDEEEMLSAMEGCRVVAGTTGGDLRVWSVKEIYAATNRNSLSDSFSDLKIQHGGRRDGASSSHVSAKPTATELAQLLSGRPLSGHRGGVSCIEVPSHVYRPETVVTGGVDGLIKLWSLRKASNRRSSGEASSPAPGRLFGRNTNLGSPGVDLPQGRTKEGGDSADALGVLTGHGGRVICARAAWHGDRLISGGADKTVRFWDLAGSGGKCLNTLSGHLGWVTQTHYWGPHTVVSASTDCSVALWDVRSQNSPLFVLRYHRSPISDILVGSRTDPLMVSAAGDGTVATWDFRTLSGRDNASEETVKKSKMIRQPLSTMNHCAESRKVKCSGDVLLSRGSCPNNGSVISVGVDAVLREWNIATGKLLRKDPTGHCDLVSSLDTFTDRQRGSSSAADPNGDSSSFGGTITGSWDGTIRIRRLISK